MPEKSQLRHYIKSCNQNFFSRFPPKTAPDRVSKVLRSNPDGGPDHAEPTGDLIKELEGPVVDVRLLKLEVVLQAGQQMRHLYTLLVSSLSNLALSHVMYVCVCVCRMLATVHLLLRICFQGPVVITRFDNSSSLSQTQMPLYSEVLVSGSKRIDQDKN